MLGVDKSQIRNEIISVICSCNYSYLPLISDYDDTVYNFSTCYYRFWYLWDTGDYRLLLTGIANQRLLRDIVRNLQLNACSTTSEIQSASDCNLSTARNAGVEVYE